VSSLLLISLYGGVIGHGDHEHSHDNIDDEMDDFDDVIPESSEADIEDGGDEAFPEDVPPTVKPRERVRIINLKYIIRVKIKYIIRMKIKYIIRIKVYPAPQIETVIQMPRPTI